MKEDVPCGNRRIDVVARVPWVTLGSVALAVGILHTMLFGEAGSEADGAGV